MELAEMMKLYAELRKDTSSTLLTTQSGLNFYYLEPTAKNIYAVLYPLLASIPRYDPTFGGKRVGGPAVNWKAIVGINDGGYPALSEGNRNALMGYTQRDYSATYKYLGIDTDVTIAAEQTGMGFDDLVGLSQISALNQELNDEEMMLLFGNSGPSGSGGNNGFALGTCGAVTISAPQAGGSIPNTDTIYVACVALTGWGVTKATATGVQPLISRTTANGVSESVSGGTSAISALAGPSAAAGSGNNSFTASVTPIKGAMGYAWFVGTGGSLATSYFYGVTSVPSAYITSLPPNTNQAGNATGLNADHSYNNLDFDGLTTLSFAQGGYFKDLNGAALTANGDGTIQEFEDVQDSLWLTNNARIPIGKIWLGGKLINSVSKAVGSAGTANSSMRIFAEMSQNGSITGGIRAANYIQKYGPNAGKPVPIETHPWLPDGCIFFDLIDNPYPQAGQAIPAVRRVAALMDHFSIQWPYTRLSYPLGVYVFMTLQHYIPFGMAMLTGIASS